MNISRNVEDIPPCYITKLTYKLQACDEPTKKPTLTAMFVLLYIIRWMMLTYMFQQILYHRKCGFDNIRASPYDD